MAARALERRALDGELDQLLAEVQSEQGAGREQPGAPQRGGPRAERRGRCAGRRRARAAASRRPRRAAARPPTLTSGRYPWAAVEAIAHRPPGDQVPQLVQRQGEGENQGGRTQDGRRAHPAEYGNRGGLGGAANGRREFLAETAAVALGQLGQGGRIPGAAEHRADVHPLGHPRVPPRGCGQAEQRRGERPARAPAQALRCARSAPAGRPRRPPPPAGRWPGLEDDLAERVGRLAKRKMSALA